MPIPSTIDVMHKLGRSPKPMGELLYRVTGKEGDRNLSILASHPLTEDRLKRMSGEDHRRKRPAVADAGGMGRAEGDLRSGRCGQAQEVTGAGHSGRLLIFFTQARTSASASGSTALTSSTVMPGLMRGS